MKVEFTRKEVKELKEIIQTSETALDLDTVDTKKIVENIFGNGMFKYGFKSSGGISVTVNPSYMTESLKIYKRFLPIILLSGKDLVTSLMSMQEKMTDLASDYIEANKNE